MTLEPQPPRKPVGDPCLDESFVDLPTLPAHELVG